MQHLKELSNIMHFHLDLGGIKNDGNFDAAARDIENRYILIDLEDLPEAIYADGVHGQWVEAGCLKACATEEGAYANALEWLAVAKKQRQRAADQVSARELERLRRDARRDKVAQEIAEATQGTHATPYSELSPSMQTAINRIIDLAEKLEVDA